MGGSGVLVALCLAITVIVISGHSEMYQKYFVLALCSIVMFFTGFIDDAIKLPYKVRFIVQAIVALIMILVGGVVLNDLGRLLWDQPLLLNGLFAIIFTSFAIIGSINAINMIDGIGGLSGSISLSSLFLIGIVAFIVGNQHSLILITAVSGGVAGFLYYNLRYASKHFARVFLGDNGSMLLGFIIGWMLIDHSQGMNPAMTPVTALWLFSIPIMDTIGVMLRRIYLGKSPLIPDHLHLHHLLLKAGFFVSEITCLLTSLHILLGAIGLAGLYLGLPEFIMLLGFLLIFIGYLWLTLQPGHFVSILRYHRILLRTRLNFASVASCGVLFGDYSAKETELIAKEVSDGLGSNINFSMRIFKQPSVSDSPEACYAITLNLWVAKDICVSKEEFNQYIISLQQQLREQRGVQLRQFGARNGDLDLKTYSSGYAFGQPKTVCRRAFGPQALVFEVTRSIYTTSFGVKNSHKSH